MKMLKFEERPKKVTAVQVTKDNVEEISKMVGGVVILASGEPLSRGYYGITYPCVEWDTSPNDAEGCWAGQGDWVVITDHGYRYSVTREVSFNRLYRKRR